MNYKIFQYVPMSKPKALTKMVPKILNANAIVILDIEDSVQDTLNMCNTPILKEEARKAIPILLDELLRKDININKKIYIRINSFESGEIEKDIEIIKNICSKLDSIGIFAPMIRHVDDLFKIKNLLSKVFHKVKLVPIIETVDGYDHLEEIIKNSDTLNIEYIHYGHYDYSLDSKQWPFVDQNEKSFWLFIDKFINLVEKSNLKYMHTPFGQLSDEILYKSVIQEVKKKCNNDFAITALNYNQVLYASDIIIAKELEYMDMKNINIRDLAIEIVDIFENNQCSKRSFSVDIKKAKFLTPHEYKMAKIYLEKIQNERS